MFFDTILITYQIVTTLNMLTSYSSRIDILVLSRYGNHLKRNEVRHDLKRYCYLDTLESVSNNVYSNVKILFDMIKKTFQIDTWLDML
jgi:hypothetical protein